MIIIKTPEQIEGIRRSSQLAADTLKYLKSYIKPGVSTEKLDKLAHRYILDHHAISADLNYEGYPKNICASINDVVCHGIPSKKDILKEGDIVNLDITTKLDGFYGDTSITFPVGKISLGAQKLIDVTKKSMNLAIDHLKPGRILNDCVGKIIESYVKKFGFSAVKELGGHGVGVKFHEDPFVYHFDYPREKVVLKPGMIFTIEPMINASPDHRVTLDQNDSWTIRTFDHSLSAQFEHTILITQTGHEILTK